MKERIGFLGCGNMGQSILEGLLAHRLARPADISVFDINTSASAYVRKKFKVATVKNARALWEKSDVILLAVKPQQLKDAVAEISAQNRKKKIVISILAGVPTRRLHSYFGRTAAIVRAMPNLGATVGESFTALASSSADALKKAETIFLCCGKTARLPERFFDLVTVLSGSGPAYYFLLTEMIAREGKRWGLSEKTALALARQTALGAGRVVSFPEISPEVWRKCVTSRGGTTEAALNVLEQKKIRTIFQQAIRAALRRAKELGRRA